MFTTGLLIRVRGGGVVEEIVHQIRARF